MPPPRCWKRGIHQRLGTDVTARLAQSAERKALNLVVVGSSPTVGVLDIVGNSMCAARHPKLSPIMVAPLYTRPDHTLLPGLSRFSCHENLQCQVDILLMAYPTPADVLLVVAATFRRCSHECVRVPHARHKQFLAVLYTCHHLLA